MNLSEKKKDIKFSNLGEKWTDDEIKNLILEIKDGISFDDIALIHKRTLTAINGKLLNIANNLINIYDIDIEIVSNKINIPVEEINNYIIKKYSSQKNNDNQEIISNELNDTTITDDNTENKLNNEIILNEEQEKAFNSFKEKKNIFLTGPAGTGKSVTLKKIIEYCKENDLLIGVTATTGSAALLIGGKTIQSYLGIGLGKESALEIFNYAKYRLSHIVKKLKLLKVLIIDEISMMNDELFDKISEYLQYVMKSKKPFGGIQIIITGDFCQLEPVNGDFCFNSNIWDKMDLEIIYLNKMIRQDGDKKFQKILEKVRYGFCTDKIYNILKNLKDTNFDNIKPTILYSKNIDVDTINNNELQKLLDSGKENMIYEIIYPTNKKIKDKAITWIKSLDIQTSIKLCIDSEVVLTINYDQNNELINGTRGIIKELHKNYIVMEKQDKNLVNISYYKSIYSEDNEIYFHYLPIKLAYAITIHRSIGMTLDAVEIDIGKKIFASGQAYTALSRVRNLNNIRIKDVSKESFIIKESVLDFYSKIDNRLN